MYRKYCNIERLICNRKMGMKLLYFVIVIVIVLILSVTSCSPLHLPKENQWGEYLYQIDYNAADMRLKNDDGNLTLTLFYSPKLSSDAKIAKMKNGKMLNLIKKEYINPCLGYKNGKISLITIHDPEEAGSFTEIWSRKIPGILSEKAVYDVNGNLVSIVALQEKNDGKAAVLIIAPADGKILNDSLIVDVPQELSGVFFAISDDLKYLIFYNDIYENDYSKKKIYFFKLNQKVQCYELMNTMDAAKYSKEKYIDFVKISHDIAVISFERGTRGHLINKQIVIFYDLNKNKILFEYKFDSVGGLRDVAISPERRYVALQFFQYDSFIRLYKIKKNDGF